MTALQATVALGIFALSVLAPQLGLTVPQLAALNTLLFTVGTLGALAAGRLLQRLGDWNVAALCAAAVAGGMLCLIAGGPLAPWVAVVLFGLAFGPETPASASVLSRVTPAARRTWVFSIRQTGNQIGAMLGSVALPLLLAVNAQLPFVAVAAVAAAMVVWCVVLSRSERASRSSTVASPPAIARGALARVFSSRPLSMLALVVLCYSAVQVCLNTYLMSLAVREWQLGVGTAAAWVAWLQAAGLFGRLYWGWLAQRMASATRLLGLLGLLIAVAGVLLMAWPSPHRGPGMVLLVGLLGFSASGWNGVLVAEVSRVAGVRHAGTLTGAVLVFGYGGLTLAPLAFAAFSGLTSMAGAFMLLCAAAGAAGIALMLTPPADTAPDC
jgi:MFS family permease